MSERWAPGLFGVISCMLASCGQDVVHVEPPFSGEGYLVIAGPDGVTKIEKAQLGSAFTFPETAENESLHLVTFVESEVLRLHPEVVLSDPALVGLYVSALSPETCPFGEAPGPNRRGYALPASAWEVFEFIEDRFQAIPEGPAWRSALRLAVPVEIGCGLSSTTLEEVPFPTASRQGYDQLVPVGGARWVGIVVFGHSLVLLDTDPPRILHEIDQIRDLGLDGENDAFHEVLVDRLASPPVVLLATSRGLFRFRIVGDQLVAFDRQFEQTEFLDVHIEPSGRASAVSADGLAITATGSEALTFESVSLGAFRLERIRSTGSGAQPYLICSKGGRVHLGDPFNRPESVRRIEPTVRSWEDVAVRPSAEAPLAYALDAGGTLIRIDHTENTSVLQTAFPPEVRDCGGPTVDVCGFRPVEPTAPRSVSLVSERGTEEPLLQVGLQGCSTVLVVSASRGCISTLDPIEGEPSTGMRWTTTTEDGIYYPRMDGRVYRWTDAR